MRSLASLPVPGAGAETSLGQGWSPGVARPEQHLSANSATLDGCPGGPGPRLCACCRSTRPGYGGAEGSGPRLGTSQPPLGGDGPLRGGDSAPGHPCPYLGLKQPSRADVTVAIVTCGAKTHKGTLGSGRGSVQPGEVRRRQRRDRAAAGLPREDGGPRPRGSGPVLRLIRLLLLPHPRPASPSESAEEHLEETAQRCWDRDSPGAPH